MAEPNRAFVNKKEAKIANAVVALYRRSEAGFTEARGAWEKYRDFYYGKQEVQTSDANDIHRPIFNLVKPAVDSGVAIITSERPAMVFSPVATQASEQAELNAYALNQVHPQVWKTINGQDRLIDMVMNAARYGAGYITVEWDPNAKGGIGDIGLKTWTPFHVYPDPDATSIEDATFITFCEEMPKATAEKMYGKKIAGGENSYGDFAKYQEENSNKTIRVYTTWIRQGVDMDEGEPNLAPKQGIRRLVTSGETVLRDNTNIYWHGQIPVVFFPWTPKPNEFLGVGMVESMVDGQTSYNQLMYLMYANLIYTGWNYVVTNREEIADQIDNTIGKVIPVEGDLNSTLKIERGKGFPQEARALAHDIKGTLYDIAGRPDAPAEAMMRSHPASGAALQTHAQQTLGRMRLVGLAYRGALEKLSRLMLSLYQQFYHQDRVFRLTDDEGQATAFVFNREDVMGEWDVAVDMDATMPASSSERFERAMALLQAGVYQPEHVLRAINDPYKVEITRAIQEAREAQDAQQREQLDAQMQMQQESDAAAAERQAQADEARMGEQEMKLDAKADEQASQHQMEILKMLQQEQMQGAAG